MIQRTNARLSLFRFLSLNIFLIAMMVQGSDAQQRNRNDFKPPEVSVSDTNQIYVELSSGMDAKTFAEQNGLEWVRTFMSHSDRHVFSASSVEQANAMVSSLRNHANVQLVGNNQSVKLNRYWAPNDPYFNHNRLGGQWHLQNDIPGSGGVSSNAMGAWAQGYTGAGVNIGVVDDGFDYTHPDLAPNYNSAYSYDFGEMDFDPSPVTADDRHGTAVSGIANARGGNGIGVTGSAPLASFSGIRLDFAVNTLADVADATAYQNQNLRIKNHSYGIGQFFYDNPLVNDVISNQSANTIHVYASGNSRQDLGKRSVANNPNTIMVGGVGWDGVRSVYTQFGSQVMVVAPTSDHDFSPTYLTTTTDVMGANGYNSGTGTDYNSGDGMANPANYTGRFGGTSSAAPLVTGILALAKEANPNLNVRIAKHLLVMTAQKVDLGNADPESDGGWRTNAAGNSYNHNYGFGVIDANALVAAAEHYTDLSPLVIENTGVKQVNRDLDTHAGNTSLTETFTLNDDTPLEDILITVNWDHDWRGDTELYLTSPSGYRSRLVQESGNDTEFGNFEWTFRTVTFWGEEGQGVWSLEMVDAFTGDAPGRWNWYSVSAYRGTLNSTGVPEPASAAILVVLLGGLLSRRKRRA